MSRVAKAPVTIPAGVEVTLNGQELSIKGGKGSLVRSIHAGVEVTKEDNVLKFAPRDGIAGADAQAGQQRHQQRRAEHGDDVLHADADGAQPAQPLIGGDDGTWQHPFAIAVKFPAEATIRSLCTRVIHE